MWQVWFEINKGGLRLSQHTCMVAMTGSNHGNMPRNTFTTQSHMISNETIDVKGCARGVEAIL